jgi:hypothetical protein
MILRIGIVTLLMLSLARVASAKDIAPLAYGGAPPCSKHDGTREFHSVVVQDDDLSAYIVGIARRDASGCHQSAAIRVESPGATRTFPLPSDADDFEIVDFSPDASHLFLAEEKSDGVRIAAMPITTGEMHWRDISDLLGWNDCDATVEPMGFTSDGRPTVRARGSVMASSTRPNCVKTDQSYAFDENWKGTAFADGASLHHFGTTVQAATQNCQTDPDLIGPCFKVHGRVYARNGAPTFRIWLSDEQRVLGVSERALPPSEPDVMPAPLAGKVSFDLYAYGDLLVCPFTPEQDGVKQMVCIESATNVIFRAREER